MLLQLGIVQSFMSAEFCDTHVFVYAYDVLAGPNREFEVPPVSRTRKPPLTQVS